MAQEGFKRKLTTIFSTDVAGYSRLMGEDEAATVRTIELYRKIMIDLITQHRGRVIDSPGDNLLAEFGSVVDAVQCAVAVQKELQTRNAGLPGNRRMEFRIGVNLGDVIEEGDRIYGDGVNIAARLEALAEPGGLCISKMAFDQIENKLPFVYEFLGDQTVKNIAKPVGVYRVKMEPRVSAVGKREKLKRWASGWRGVTLFVAIVVVILITGVVVWNFYFRLSVEPASVERMKYPLPDTPSIAVLPFTNFSGDPEQEYFSDGLTEEIITALSNVRYLFVVARNSTFAYKGKPINVKQVAEDLGVRYVLEGSVRKSGDRIRITAQLIDAIKGSHLWAERYDREMKDVFALQDDITKKIITELQVTLTEGEQARLWEKGTKNIEAYLKFLQGLNQERSAEGNIRRIQLLEEAIALDPQYAAAYAWLAFSHIDSIRLGRGVSRKKAVEKAFELAKKAVSLDESNADCHFVLGRIYRYKKDYEKALTHLDRALSLNPNHVFANFIKGLALRTLERNEEAISYLQKALRLNPLDTVPIQVLGSAYADMGRYGNAIPYLEKAFLLNPNDVSLALNLTRAYMGFGRENEARETVKEVLKIAPEMTVDRFKTMNAHRFKDVALLEVQAGLLRKAGLPEK